MQAHGLDMAQIGAPLFHFLGALLDFLVGCADGKFFGFGGARFGGMCFGRSVFRLPSGVFCAVCLMPAFGGFRLPALQFGGKIRHVFAGDEAGGRQGGGKRARNRAFAGTGFNHQRACRAVFECGFGHGAGKEFGRGQHAADAAGVFGEAVQPACGIAAFADGSGGTAAGGKAQQMPAAAQVGRHGVSFGEMGGFVGGMLRQPMRAGARCPCVLCLKAA